MRGIVALTNDKGERLHIRQTIDPEPFHREIYRALNLPPKAIQNKIMGVRKRQRPETSPTWPIKSYNNILMIAANFG